MLLLPKIQILLQESSQSLHEWIWKNQGIWSPKNKEKRPERGGRRNRQKPMLRWPDRKCGLYYVIKKPFIGGFIWLCKNITLLLCEEGIHFSWSVDRKCAAWGGGEVSHFLQLYNTKTDMQSTNSFYGCV